MLTVFGIVTKSSVGEKDTEECEEVAQDHPPFINEEAKDADPLI